MKIQIYDSKIHVYDSTNLIALHDVSTQKFNYSEEDYTTLSEMTFNDKYININQFAKNNLRKIGEMYND